MGISASRMSLHCIADGFESGTARRNMSVSWIEPGSDARRALPAQRAAS